MELYSHTKYHRNILKLSSVSFQNAYRSCYVLSRILSSLSISYWSADWRIKKKTDKKLLTCLFTESPAPFKDSMEIEAAVTLEVLTLAFGFINLCLDLIFPSVEIPKDFHQIRFQKLYLFILRPSLPRASTSSLISCTLQNDRENSYFILKLS